MLSLLVKLNGGRNIVGILRGFDPFMNLVIDETVEEAKDGTKNNIGMVVCFIFNIFFFLSYISSSHIIPGCTGKLNYNVGSIRKNHVTSI